MSATLPRLTEREFMDQVTQLAEIRGWSWAHFRPAQTAKGWRTPVSGPLGKGWPDLVLVRERDGRLIFAELKRDRGRLTADQERVLGVLRSTSPFSAVWSGAVLVQVWSPEHWPMIEAVLK